MMGKNRKQLEKKMILLEMGVWERGTVDAEMDGMGGNSAKCYGPRVEAAKNLENLSKVTEEADSLFWISVHPALASGFPPPSLV
jgi:hypothetical protein